MTTGLSWRLTCGVTQPLLSRITLMQLPFAKSSHSPPGLAKKPPKGPLGGRWRSRSDVSKDGSKLAGKSFKRNLSAEHLAPQVHLKRLGPPPGMADIHRRLPDPGHCLSLVSCSGDKGNMPGRTVCRDTCIMATQHTCTRLDDAAMAAAGVQQ